MICCHGKPLHRAVRPDAYHDVAVESVLSNPAPNWWGPFCLGIDMILALALAVMLWRGQTLD
jgi:hypothetical protein